jgi:aspartate kinase
MVEKLDELATRASSIFDVQLQKQLTLITVRNYNKEIIEKLLKDKTVLLQQQTTTTFQALCF